MDKFLKKRPSPNGAKENPAKRARGTTAADDSHLLPAPHVIVAWNCNGLTSRLRSGDGPAIKAFIEKHLPDVIFLSEVRVAAANNSSTGKPGPHTKWFRSRMRDSDKKALEDVSLVNAFFNSNQLAKYKPYLSLADTKYAGTAMLLNTETTAAPISVRYNLQRMDVKGSVHDDDGRVIVAKFSGFSILHTYAPNNGWEEDHFNRRRAWDEKILQFMQRKKAAGVNIMWVGDLNVAPLDVDLSHPTHYKKQKGGRNSGRAKVPAKPIAPEDIGQPGCTPSERTRFANVLEDGDLVDAYRELVGESDNSGLSWRGHTTGKHAGRGMRIDHCIISNCMMPSIESVKITGYGFERVGFLGSDHSPLLITRRSNENGDNRVESNESKDAQTANTNSHPSTDGNAEQNGSTKARANADIEDAVDGHEGIAAKSPEKGT